MNKQELYDYLKREGILINSKPNRFNIFMQNIKDIKEQNKSLKKINKNLEKENSKLKEEILTCQICEEKFKNIKSLRNHIRIHRKNPKDPLDEIFVNKHDTNQKGDEE